MARKGLELSTARNRSFVSDEGAFLCDHLHPLSPFVGLAQWKSVFEPQSILKRIGRARNPIRASSTPTLVRRGRKSELHANTVRPA